MGHGLRTGPEVHHKKDKKAGKFDDVRKVHPMFEAHRYHPGAPAFHGAYGYPRPNGHPMGYPGYGPPAGYMGYDSHHPQAVRDHGKKSKFDSTMLLGNENDTSYLDNFMNTTKSLTKDSKSKAKATATDIKHGRKSVTSSTPTSERSSGLKNSRSHSSLNLNSVAKTLLNKMRSAASDEEIYESMEIINHRKTLESITKRDQTAKVKKTKHPLFDHLRTEKILNDYKKQSQSNTLPLPRERALSPDGRDSMVSPRRHRGSPPDQIWPTTGPLSKHPARRGDQIHGTSDGNSSGSGDDDFNYAPRPNHRFSRSAVLNTRQDNGNNLEDSDDDWAIPRPSFGLGERARRSGATGVKHHRQISTDESDSSSKSTGLR